MRDGDEGGGLRERTGLGESGGGSRRVQSHTGSCRLAQRTLPSMGACIHQVGRMVVARPPKVRQEPQYVHRASKCDNKQSVSDPLALQNCQNNKDTGTDAVKAKSKICKATSTVICAFVTQSLSLRLLFRLLWYRFRCFLYRSRDCRRLLGRRGRLHDGRRSI